MADETEVNSPEVETLDGKTTELEELELTTAHEKQVGEETVE